jgi:uncharacterized protein YhaN
MKITRLDLKAFGPFADQVLEFQSQNPGLHIIFGPNEAGKSSSLRALKALLYGFPERTADNFRHPNHQLLVGGCLIGSDGKELSFFRRKKRKADILDPEGNPLDSGVVASFLHGVEPEVFESLYGLDHETLVRGGQDILAQKGDVGKTLFAAGAGISSLREILDSLEAEGDELFKARGSKQEINQALAKYKELQKDVKADSLSGREWKEHQKALEEAEKELERVEKERNEKDRLRRHLERLKRALPHLALRRSLRQKMQELGPVILLPEDFSDQRQRVEQEARESKQQQQRAAMRLEELKAKEQSVYFNPGLIEQSDRIEALYQKLGEYRKGAKDRIRLDGMRISLRKEASESLRQVQPDLPLEKVEALRPALTKRRGILSLASQHESLYQKASHADQQYQDSERELKDIYEVFSRLPEEKNVANLAQAIKLAQKIGDIDQIIDEKRQEAEEERQSCLADLKRLGLWRGDLVQLTEIPFPFTETVRYFENQFKEQEDKSRQLRRDREELKKEMEAACGEIKKIEYAGEVPTEEDLDQTREKRDQGWKLLRRRWLNKEEIEEESRAYDPPKDLPEAYEQYVNLSDNIADRLRREADRVANFASLRARIDLLQASLKGIEKEAKECEEHQKGLSDRWVEQWKKCGILPLSPYEMAAWLTGVEKLRFRIGDIRKKEKEIKEKSLSRQALRETLLEELTALGEVKVFTAVALSPVLVFAETVLTSLESLQRDRLTLEEKRREFQKKLEKAQQERTTAEKGLKNWRSQWESALQPLALGYTVVPAEAVDLFEALQNCFAKLKEAEDCEMRIAGIDLDASSYDSEVGIVLQKVAPELDGQPLEQTVVRLHGMLSQASRDKDQLERYSEEMKAAKAEIQEAEAALKALDEQMAGLLETAKCSGPKELNDAIGKDSEFRKLKEKISDVETALAQIAEGISLEELEKQASEVDSDELPGKIASISREIEEKLNPEVKRLSQIIGEERKELQRMDGSAKAAQAAEAAEQVLARLRRLTNRYVRLKLAAKILQQEIERYRAKHQDPVLKIASRYFAELTLGSFAGLRTDVDDQGQPVLAGMRQDESRVTVEGMSSGTRDQLYLALRLASLEWRLKSSEPMPFIVDDILINFDDERSRATLKALADLAKKYQVILFTHHRQIVETARTLGKGDYVFIHELGET